jgi:hypothetical protein
MITIFAYVVFFFMRKQLKESLWFFEYSCRRFFTRQDSGLGYECKRAFAPLQVANGSQKSVERRPERPCSVANVRRQDSVVTWLRYGRCCGRLCVVRSQVTLIVCRLLVHEATPEDHWPWPVLAASGPKYCSLSLVCAEPVIFFIQASIRCF